MRFWSLSHAFRLSNGGRGYGAKNIPRVKKVIKYQYLLEIIFLQIKSIING